MKTAPTVRRFALLTLVGAVSTALALACGGESPMNGGGGGGGVASVSVSPAEDSIAVGETTRFSASAQDADGGSVSTSFTWSSTNTSVATVDDQGVATGQGGGMAEIVAEADGVADSAELTVTSGGGASAASIQAVSGSGQHGVTTRSYADSLVVEAQDDNGDPVSDVQIDWAVASGDASFSSSTTTTGSDGRARVEVTAGTSTGPITVEATADGAQGSPVSFDLDTSVALVIVGDNFFEDPNGRQNGNASVSIAVGDTVLWEWQGSNPHTVTSDSSPSGGSSFDSGQQTSNTFQFIPQTTGTWTYFCEVHPSIMTGAEIQVSS